MSGLSHLGVRNLRSLRYVPPIRIAPITVLLGRNSVGKSTFARIFPLLRQSSERKKKSPILWFGDLVDFGSLERSVTEGESEIGFNFHIEIDRPRKRHMVRRTQSEEKTLAEVSLTLVEDEQQTGHAKSIGVKIFGGEITINPMPGLSMETPFAVNGVQYVPPSKEQGVIAFQGDVLPLIFFYQYYKDPKDPQKASSWVQVLNHWDDLPTQVVRKYVHSNTSIATCRRIANRISLGTVKEIEQSLKHIPGPPSWQAVVESNSAGKLANELHQVLLVSHVEEIFKQLDAALKSYFQGVRYLKPLRATAERYYRKLDLSVSEIEADGSNLPMFLDSLNATELESFRKWVKVFLGVDAFPKRQGDQVMVMAQGKNDPKAFNIADMGFGISQVLPIAAQLWVTTRPVAWSQKSSMVVLEQPELHLHPDSQARLADVFVGAIKSENTSKNAPSIVVETHSQHLVNRLGQLVESGRLNTEDVSIVLFESTGGTSPSTKVRVSSFSEDGVLQNWPYGFFEPEID